MQMIENGIVKNYREAKDKREQINILADLNCCSKEEITEILLKNGVDQRELPRKRKPRKKPEESRKHSAIDTVVSVLAQRIKEIDKELQEHGEVIETLEREKEDIVSYIDGMV